MRRASIALVVGASFRRPGHSRGAGARRPDPGHSPAAVPAAQRQHRPRPNRVRCTGELDRVHARDRRQPHQRTLALGSYFLVSILDKVGVSVPGWLVDLIEGVGDFSNVSIDAKLGAFTSMRTTAATFRSSPRHRKALI